MTSRPRPTCRSGRSTATSPTEEPCSKDSPAGCRISATRILAPAPQASTTSLPNASGSWLCSTSTTQLRRAEAVFNADPRQFSDETEDNTRLFREIVADGFPDLDEREQLRITAVIRCLVSSQAWLRMSEEFGIPGAESGPVVAWVIDMIVRELRAGNRPDWS